MASVEMMVALYLLHKFLLVTTLVEIFLKVKEKKNFGKKNALKRQVVVLQHVISISLMGLTRHQFVKIYQILLKNVMKKIQIMNMSLAVLKTILKM